MPKSLYVPTGCIVHAHKVRQLFEHLDHIFPVINSGLQPVAICLNLACYEGLCRGEDSLKLSANVIPPEGEHLQTM